jgi:tripartite-type tricarboxylate transporter receptor subunit TctC
MVTLQRRWLIGLACLLCAPWALSAVAHAQTGPGKPLQNYPTKPVRLVAPFPPGGGTDLLSRLLAVPIGESLGQPVIVDNRPGAGGVVGADIVARSEPDGHTLILVSGSYAATSAYRRKIPYDPVDGIQSIALLGTTGLLMTCHPSVPAAGMKELIAHARANPGKINYASVGIGSVNHLSHELFKLMAKIDIVHVPYKGAGPGLTALIGGEIQIGSFSLVPSIPHLRAGRLRALGITSAKRSALLPDVPAIAEAVPGYIVDHWYGMWGPKGIPAPIVTRWNKEVARVLTSEEMKRQLRGEGLETAGGPPSELHAVLKHAIGQWRKVIVEARIPQTE